jgi:hypothetical protein
MADLTNSVTGATNVITNIIVWISTAFANIVKNIGFTEIIVVLVIIFCIYLWANQHSLETKRVLKF